MTRRIHPTVCLKIAFAACVLLLAAPVHGNGLGLKQTIASGEEISVDGSARFLPSATYENVPGDGPYQHREEFYSEHEAYEGPGGEGPGPYDHSEEQHYEQSSDSGPGYHHSEQHYELVEVKAFTMQMTGSTRDAATNITTSSFRCSKEEDEPDFCLHPAYSHEDRYKDTMRRNHYFKDLMARSAAATCTWWGVGLGGACPTGSDSTCFPASINCTFAPPAKECGCPFESTAFFSAKGYVIVKAGKSCQEEFDPLNARVSGRRRLASASVLDGRPYGRGPYSGDANNVTTYNVSATIFRGHINSMRTGQGLKRVKGKVEFVPQLTRTEEKRTIRSLPPPPKQQAPKQTPSQMPNQIPKQQPPKQQVPKQAPSQMPNQIPKQQTPKQQAPSQMPNQIPKQQAPKQFPKQGSQQQAQKHDVPVGVAAISYGPEEHYYHTERPEYPAERPEQYYPGKDPGYHGRDPAQYYPGNGLVTYPGEGPVDYPGPGPLQGPEYYPQGTGPDSKAPDSYDGEGPDSYGSDSSDSYGSESSDSYGLDSSPELDYEREDGFYYRSAAQGAFFRGGSLKVMLVEDDSY